MTNEDIEATLALRPKEATAIIMERFYFKRRFYWGKETGLESQK